MRYRVEHSKINLISPRAHVLFFIYYTVRQVLLQSVTGVTNYKVRQFYYKVRKALQKCGKTRSSWFSQFLLLRCPVIMARPILSRYHWNTMPLIARVQD